MANARWQLWPVLVFKLTHPESGPGVSSPGHIIHCVHTHHINPASEQLNCDTSDNNNDGGDGDTIDDNLDNIDDDCEHGGSRGKQCCGRK